MSDKDAFVDPTTVSLLAGIEAAGAAADMERARANRIQEDAVRNERALRDALGRQALQNRFDENIEVQIAKGKLKTSELEMQELQRELDAVNKAAGNVRVELAKTKAHKGRAEVLAAALLTIAEQKEIERLFSVILSEDRGGINKVQEALRQCLSADLETPPQAQEIMGDIEGACAELRENSADFKKFSAERLWISNNPEKILRQEENAARNAATLALRNTYKPDFVKFLEVLDDVFGWAVLKDQGNLIWQLWMKAAREQLGNPVGSTEWDTNKEDLLSALRKVGDHPPETFQYAINPLCKNHIESIATIIAEREFEQWQSNKREREKRQAMAISPLDALKKSQQERAAREQEQKDREAMAVPVKGWRKWFGSREQ